MVTHEELTKLLDYDPETGIFERTSKTGSIKQAGSLRKDGYRHLYINNKCYLEHRLAWFYVYGVWPKDQIDHINGIKDANYIDNLREATHSENMKNQKGKGYRKNYNKWTARIKLNGKEIYLGSFETEKGAALAYNVAAKKYHGEFANLNEIE